jgi:hypothetical protein
MVERKFMGLFSAKTKKRVNKKRGGEISKLIGIKTPLIIRKTMKQNNKV